MTGTLKQRFIVNMLIFSARVLWVFDLLAVTAVSSIVKIAGNFTAVIISIGFFGFWFTSLHTGYLAELGDGLIAYTINPIVNSSSEQGTVLGANAPLKAPVKVLEMETPEISARSALVIDRASGEELYSLNKNEKLAPASTTKLMTALVALDIFDLEEELTVPADCPEIEAQKAYLPAGSNFKMRSLLNSMLIASSSDSACTLASAKVEPESFINLMNKKARDLGMNSTFFSNAIGLDGVDGTHYSTAYDLYILAENAIQSKPISNAVKVKEYSISDSSGAFRASLYNTNQLLWELPQTVGIKTGTTVAAGEVLIYQFLDDQKDLVIIVMGSEDRFSDTKRLLGWVNATYEWPEAQ